MNNEHILILRRVLFNVADEIIRDGEYKDGTGEAELRAIDAFFTQYPTLGQLERDGKLVVQPNPTGEP